MLIFGPNKLTCVRMLFWKTKTISSSINENPIISDTIPTSFIIKIKNYIDYIWPIRSSELVKFILITTIMFGILGIQNLIRALKDGLVNTLIGTETVSFLKFWGVMPASIIITLIYIKLTTILKGETIFYLIISTFLGFFVLFGFVLFPNSQYLHLSKEKVEYLILTYPHAKWFIVILSNWVVSLFYIIAELWPNVVYALLFWQFVNKITSVDQSARFYPLFGMFSQSGLVLSGIFLTNLPRISQYVVTNFGITLSEHELTIKIILSVVSILGIILLILFWLLNNKILDQNKIEMIEIKIRKNPLTIFESFKLVMNSRYILLITLLLMCYGMSINLIEGPWKYMLSKQYTNPTEFTVFVGKYLTYTGIFTIGFSIIGSNIVRRFGWYTAAMITPIMIMVTGTLFFVSSTSNQLTIILGIFGVIKDPILLAIVIGTIQNILSKSTKYAIFDSTKEMAYVPLTYELKTSGKAAADLIGTKLGKSTSAFIQTIVFIIFPGANFGSIFHYLMFIFLLICTAWIFVIIKLNKEYHNEIAINEQNIG